MDLCAGNRAGRRFYRKSVQNDRDHGGKDADRFKECERGRDCQEAPHNDTGVCGNERGDQTSILGDRRIYDRGACQRPAGAHQTMESVRESQAADGTLTGEM